MAPTPSKSPTPAPPAPRAVPPGPRPLPLHVALQTMIWMSARAALGSLKSGSLPWRPELAEAAAALREDLGRVDPDAFAGAVDAEACRRLGAFADGVRAYRHHARRPGPADPPGVWSEGSTRLLDYGAGAQTGAGAVPLVVVPSLINRAYILDLTEKRSLVRTLAARGFRPFLVDWGAPGAAERAFTLSDYVAGRLEAALATAVDLAGRPAGVIRYCMGGLLALALAQRRPDRVAALALMGTPWDFHAGQTGKIRLLKAMAPQLAMMMEHLGVLPVDVLQAMFMSLDPYLTSRKFQRFAALDGRSQKARHFVVLEDWLNDGVPLAGPVAHECLVGWYVENRPARGAWRIAGRPVLPAEVQARSLVMIPGKDHIVPPASAAPLAEALPRAERRVLGAGHIGMVAGGRAATILYGPLARWLKAAMT